MRGRVWQGVAGCGLGAYGHCGSLVIVRELLKVDAPVLVLVVALQDLRGLLYSPGGRGSVRLVPWPCFWHEALGSWLQLRVELRLWLLGLRLWLLGLRLWLLGLGSGPLVAGLCTIVERHVNPSPQLNQLLADQETIPILIELLEFAGSLHEGWGLGEDMDGDGGRGEGEVI